MRSKPDRLRDYREKRDFRRTSEPSGGRKESGKQPIFVIQKHAASTLHYDFRLEANGLLKSWAIPKGPSTDPQQKRLAMPTEDHPLDYADFEGAIPQGEYGAGTVLVWDAGTYRNITHHDKQGGPVPVERALKDGHVAVWLKGRKLKGGYALTRTAKGKDERWILVKMRDAEADPHRNPVATELESVLSGRTLEEIAQQGKLPGNQKRQGSGA
jgi:DNA ligase D-like protein (predicted 3'-phosphoesterase)